MMRENEIVIFCDGACSGNPGPGGWGSVVAAQGDVWELGGGNPATTNNQMEMTAIIEALKSVAHLKQPVHLHTDSAYAIRGITQWVRGWRYRGWKTADGKDVANQDLWQEMDSVVSARGKGSGVHWHFVRGHSGIPGNERCDEIAVAFSQGVNPRLYRGPLSVYPVDLDAVPEDTSLPEIKPRQEKAKATGYLSLIGTIPMWHATWAECERRVKGQSGAKFKKVTSPSEESAILKSWGVSPDVLKKS